MICLKNILILVLGVLLAIFYGTLASVEDGLLSKFHQNAYKLRNQRADVVRMNREVVNRFELRTFKFNRTVTAFNMTISSKYDVDEQFDFILQAYKRYSNEYRLFPMRMRLNYCRYFNKNVFGLLNALKCGNVTSCLLKKDVVYHICNFVIDESKFPPLIPTGEFKAEIIGMYGDVEVGAIDAYAEIYLPIKIT